MLDIAKDNIRSCFFSSPSQFTGEETRQNTHLQIKKSRIECDTSIYLQSLCNILLGKRKQNNSVCMSIAYFELQKSIFQIPIIYILTSILSLRNKCAIIMQINQCKEFINKDKKEKRKATRSCSIFALHIKEKLFFCRMSNNISDRNGRQG